VEKIWGKGYLLSHFFRGKTGLVLKKDESKRMLSIDFVDKIHILQKVSHMGTITDVDQLKNYFHYTLQSLRKSPFYTEDYELTLEEVFEQRLTEITDLMLDQAKGQLERLEDLNEIHSIYTDLTDRALEIGLTGDQRHRLNDVYELRKDQVRREKLKEIDGFIGKIKDSRVLREYWDNVKWYLLDNRPLLGKEFENLIAKKFDEAMAGMKDM
jgi:hypothetical protein